MKNRIKHFRNLRGMTLRQLGLMVGFPEKNADVRIAQYEANDRVPKAACLAAIAKALNVSPHALTVTNVEDTNKLMHLLFVLEDRFGLATTRLLTVPMISWASTSMTISSLKPLTKYVRAA